MTREERERYDRALRTARLAAYPRGDFVEQEGFMRAGEIRSLARRAGVGPGVTVLDLCCGVGGPGRLITAALGCTYLGIDRSAGAVEVARDRADGAGLACRFAVAEVPPVPPGPFDVVLLLETMLAFADKEALAGEVAAALVPGGRFACTVEEGRPLTAAEREAMPAGDTVWPVPLPELVGLLSGAGLDVRWTRDCTRSHRSVAAALGGAFLVERPTIAARLGARAADDLLAAHRLWTHWLATGRVRKVALVAERSDSRPAAGARSGERRRAPLRSSA